MMGRRIDVGLRRLFECEATLFQGVDDLTFSFRRDNNEVGIVGCDEEKRTVSLSGTLMKN